MSNTLLQTAEHGMPFRQAKNGKTGTHATEQGGDVVNIELRILTEQTLFGTQQIRQCLFNQGARRIPQKRGLIGCFVCKIAPQAGKLDIHPHQRRRNILKVGFR